MRPALIFGIAIVIIDAAVASATKKPNFILYFPDTLRAESHTPYGAPLDTTPHLNKFASGGVLFEQAHVMHTQCSPSRCTMLTGRFMHVGGHRTQTHLIQDYEANYFRALKENGYHVEMIGKNDVFSGNALNLSVSHWDAKIGYASGPNAFDFPQPGYFSFLSSGSNISGADESNGDYAAVRQAISFLQSKPPEPFVLFLPTRGAHPPYGAPREWHSKFTPEQVKAAGITLRPRGISGMPTYMSAKAGIPHYRNLEPLDDDFFYRVQAVYLGMVAYTDWLFGELLSGLAAADGGRLERKTAVIFSSDHGDFSGDYGLVEKWPGSMSDVLTRVPLVVRLPGGVAGGVARAPVQTADVLETMLDVAGINASWERFGVSLRAQLEQGAQGDMGRDVFGEGGFYFRNEQQEEAGECLADCPRGLYCPRGQEEAQPNGSPRASMIRNLTAKLVYRPTGVSELYDLVVDPRETANLYTSSAHATLRAELLVRLLDHHVLTSDVTPTHTDRRGLPKFPYLLPSSDPWAAPMTMTPTREDDPLAINGVSQV